MPCAAHAARSRAASPTADVREAPPGATSSCHSSTPDGASGGGFQSARDRGPRAPPSASTTARSAEATPVRALACSRGDGGRAADDRGVGSRSGRRGGGGGGGQGDVRAEDAAVGVALVDGDHLEVGQHVGPLAMLRQDAGVEDVGVGEKGVALPPQLRPVDHRRVAVEGGGEEVRARRVGERAQRRELVVCEGLGREEEERARVRVGAHRRHERQHVGERLAGGGRRAHADVAAAAHRRERLRLVREEPPIRARGAPPRPPPRRARRRRARRCAPAAPPTGGRARAVRGTGGCAASQPQSVAAVTASPSLQSSAAAAGAAAAAAAAEAAAGGAGDARAVAAAARRSCCARRRSERRSRGTRPSAPRAARARP